MLQFEDIEVGWRRTYGRHPVGRDEVIAFATAWDPRDIHVDDAAARAKDYLDGEGVCASGLHTLSIWARLQAIHMADLDFMLGAGFEQVRFLRPVWPGDVLSVLSEVRHKRELPERPGRGLVHFHHEVLDQDGKPVMRLDVRVVMRRRS